MRSAVRPSSSSAIIGTSRSLWPRPISSCLWAMQRAPSNRAAVQAALDVSNARIMGRIVVICGPMPQPLDSDRFDGLDFGDVVPDQTLDTALQSDGRRRAARAGAV